MARVIQTQQLVTLRKPFDHADETAVLEACERLVRTIARELQGFYEQDGVGFVSADGEVMVKEY